MKQGATAKRDISDCAKIFQIIGNPLRLKILYHLLENPLCVCDLAEILKHRHSCVSQQLMYLRKTGLVKVQRIGWYHYYSISSDRVKNHLQYFLNNWEDESDVIFSSMSEENE